ncbi:MAG: peptidase M14 [Myxococcales bacterium]|nr:peptidase M14 [Myxococcales bacterium]
MRSLAFVLLLAACTASHRPRPQLTTIAESSQYTRTGRYEEAIRLCHDFARAYAEARCDTLGQTGEGRPILALRISRHTGLPVIYVQAGIHAGEIEGKDAGFWFLRDLLDGKVAPGALDHVSVAFIPVMNPDGHEHFGPNHRPNQRGPEEMGWRTNGARQNLNRDFMKAEAPETQAVLRLLQHDQPVLLVDLHTTDGAKFEHDIAITPAPFAPRIDQLDETEAELTRAVTSRLTELGHLPLGFYPSFVNDDDPLSGFAAGEAPPRFTHFYMAARSRLALLVETHSWRTYKERAHSTYHALQAIFETATRDSAHWREVELAADRSDLALAGTQVPLIWDTGPGHRELAFRGYAFEKRTSELTGGTWLVYDETTPQIWKVPFYDDMIPTITVTAPRGGYLVDGGFASAVAAVLDRHGLSYVRLTDEPKVSVGVFRATKATFSEPYEGRTRVGLTGAWSTETRTLERGAIFIPIAQPGVRVILHLMDPALPDSLAAWGLFNAVFERKEYIEPYVIEAAAREMLATQPALRAEFEAAIAADPALAKSAEAKREWFYRRHPSWDERTNLLPVYRTDAVFGAPRR